MMIAKAIITTKTKEPNALILVNCFIPSHSSHHYNIIKISYNQQELKLLYPTIK